MSNIEVGDYVRTKDKGIKKIDHLNINHNATINKYRYFLGIDKDGDRCYGTIKTTEILKHSKNIIDLIEVGDIIQYWYEDNYYQDFVYAWVDKELLEYLKGNKINEDIKSIVTKEIFKEMEYRVNE